MNEWPIAINTYSYIWKYDAHETLNRLADKGYRQFEFLISPPHCWPESLTQADRARVSALLASRDLEILVLNPPSLDLNLVSAAGEMRRYTVDHYLRVIDLAADWNVPYVLVVPGKTHPLLAPPKERVWSWFLSAIEELERHAERVGVRLILENVPASFLPKADDLMRAIERLGIERVGIAYDVANAVFVREAPVDGLRMRRRRYGLSICRIPAPKNGPIHGSEMESFRLPR